MLNPGLKDTIAGIVPITATSLPLPTGAATQTTLAAIKVDVDRIPTLPSTDETLLLLEKILVTLRKIEIHLSEATNTEIDDGEIDEES